MRRAGVEHHPRRHALLAQRGEPLLGLPGRAALVGDAVHHQGRRADLFHLGQRGKRRVVRPVLRRDRAEFGDAEVVAAVGRACHADHVADDPARDRRGEAVVPAGEVAGHEAAVAVAGHGEPPCVGHPLGDEGVQRLEEVPGVGHAPGADRRGVERFAVAVAAARVEQQHRPAARDEFLVVEVHGVGGAVPRVVRAAVDVQQQRPGTAAGGIAQQPAGHDRAVGDGELPFLVGERLEVGRLVRGPHFHRSPGDADRRDLPVGRRRGEHDRRRVPGDGHRRHGGSAATGEEPRFASPGVDRVQLGVAAVAGAEQHGGAGRPRERAGVAGTARHDVPVQRRRQIDGFPAVQGNSQQPEVPGCGVAAADGEQRGAVGGPVDRGAHAVAGAGQAGLAATVTGLDDVRAGAERQVGIGVRSRGKRQERAVRRPGGVTRVPVPRSHLPDLAGGDVEDVDVLAQRPQQPGAVGLEAEPVGDHRSTRAAGPGGVVFAFVRGEVDRGGEGDLRAVRAPDRGARAERERGDLLGLTAIRGQQPHLGGTVLGAQEREPGAVRRPGGCQVCGAAGQPPRRTAAGGDLPERPGVLVLVPVGGAQDVDDPGAVRRNRRLLGELEGGQVVGARTSGHADLLVGWLAA